MYSKKIVVTAISIPLSDRVEIVRERLAKFVIKGKPSLGAAQRLISDSAYWYSHPKGCPVKAPNHYKNIVQRTDALELDFGANAFLVGQAILRCHREIEAALQQVLNAGSPTSESELRVKLELHVRGCVSNYYGDEYSNLWRVNNGHMRFGAQSIHVGEFIRCFSQLAELHLIAM